MNSCFCFVCLFDLNSILFGNSKFFVQICNVSIWILCEVRTPITISILLSIIRRVSSYREQWNSWRWGRKRRLNRHMKILFVGEYYWSRHVRFGAMLFNLPWSNTAIDNDRFRIWYRIGIDNGGMSTMRNLRWLNWIGFNWQRFWIQYIGESRFLVNSCSHPACNDARRRTRVNQEFRSWMAFNSHMNFLVHLEIIEKHSQISSH